MSEYKIQYSDNYVSTSNPGTWTTVATVAASQAEAGSTITTTIDNYQTNGAHRYWRLYV